MTLDRRLQRITTRLRATKPPEAPFDLDENQWLAAFEALGDAGHFVHEPDFPKALAEYRDALDAAHRQADPLFDPPAKFPAARFAPLPANTLAFGGPIP
jgi:hypothetical protein